MIKLTPTSFADITALVGAMPGPDAVSTEEAREHESKLTKPPGALGRLEALAQWLAAWQGCHPPRITRPVVLVFAGSHGVTCQGVSAYPPAVTEQMVRNFEVGGAAINQICRVVDAELEVINLAQVPTRDFTTGPAMDEPECVAAMAKGMEAVTAGTDLLAIGEMGIGNTTAAAAICYGLYGGTTADWTGPGTGLVGAALSHKMDVVGKAVAAHRERKGDPLGILRCLGGREIAAMVGAIISARYARVPVLIDGFVVSTAAAILHSLDESALEHCVVAHLSAESGHSKLLQRIELTPLFDFGMRLGEGSGAGLAVSILRAAAECHAGMATFAQAGVADKGD